MKNTSNNKEKELSLLIDKLESIPAKEQKSGVELIGYQKLKFKEHIWNKYHEIKGVVSEYQFTCQELISLVDMVVKVDDLDVYKVRNKRRGEWETYGSKTTVYEKLRNDYQEFMYYDIEDRNIIHYNTLPKIKLAIYGKTAVYGKNDPDRWDQQEAGSIPSVYQVVDYPMIDEFLVTDKGQFVLNEGSSFKTLESATDYEKASKILLLIFRNLTNHPVMKDKNGNEITPDEERFILYDMVLSNNIPQEYKDFKFVLHWLAAIIQRPGINLMTNIWFTGEYQGIGKGTLVALMSLILGSDKIANCKSNMILGSFNAPFYRKMILSINEKQEGVTPEQMTNFLKGFAQESTLQIEKKGQDPFTTINIINVMGSCQDPSHVFKIEDEDRRNVIFRTIESAPDPDRLHRKFAKEIAVNSKDDIMWAKSFAFLLERVDIDYNLISTAYKTRGYTEMKTEQISNSNEVYDWASVHFKFIKDKTLLSDLRNDYLKGNAYRDITQNMFNKKIRDLENVDGVRKFTIIKPGNIPTIKWLE